MKSNSLSQNSLKNGPVRRHTQTHQKSKLSKWTTIVQLINCLWNTPRGGPRRGPRRWVVRDLVSLSIWITVAVWWFNYSFRAVFFWSNKFWTHAAPKKFDESEFYSHNLCNSWCWNLVECPYRSQHFSEYIFFNIRFSNRGEKGK